jgi:hypothetical protein
VSEKYEQIINKITEKKLDVFDKKKEESNNDNK